MKNLTKIFMAVAVAMIAFACATDLTDDLGVQLGGGENGANGATVELSLSLEESRTQLGEKDADGLYPIYWSEGDEISANGVASVAQISEENPAYATFAVAEADKYEVAYPVANAGQVNFATKQNHVAAGNTFESGVATMYGTGTVENGIVMHHLTGVLKFAVVGEAVLSKIQISTIDRAPIAGAFDIDFATGELTATEASKKSIEYSFGEEGLQLTSEAQWMHVAVPAGQYDELYVTLYEQGNSGNIMYATVKANDDPETEKEEKPVVAGSVREFNTPIIYSPNAQLFVIDSPERLSEFKIKIESEAGLTMDAILTEDIDMTGYSWISIAGTKYTNTIYGNGYAIKGLNAPLFSKAAASFKGLHLEDVNINTNSVYLVGALASTLLPSDDVYPSVENCSVSGTITIENPELSASNVICGGFVGTAVGAKFDGCVNNAKIKVKQLTTENSGKKVYLGGIAAYAEGRHAEGVESVYTTFVNSKNYGDIDMSECADGTTTTSVTSIGGILGYSNESEDKNNFGLVIENCENGGALIVKGTIPTLYLGGINGYTPSNADAKSTIRHAVNTGALTIKEGSTVSSMKVGGIAGLGQHSNNKYNGHIYNSTNGGTITVERGTIFSGAVVGGIVGDHRGGEDAKGYLQECVNNGAINFGGDAADATSISIMMGGIAGYTQGYLNNVTNNGDLTISGNLNVSNAASADFAKGANIYFAGITGYKTVSNVNGVANHGDVTLSSNITSLTTDGKLSQVNVAGIFGYSSKQAYAGDIITQSVSDGKIIVSGNTTGCQLCIGGAYSHVYTDLVADVKCEADIEISGTHTGKLYVGGITSAHIDNMTGLTFDGSIKVKEDAVINGECALGGIAGIHRGYDAGKQMTGKNLTNNGTITFAGTIDGYLSYTAGCVGLNDKDTTVGASTADDTKDDANAPNYTNLTNTGDVTFEGVAKGENVHTGGCVGRATGTVNTAENTGTVTFKGNGAEAKTCYAGGVISVANNIVANIVNKGTVQAVNGAQYQALVLGGIFGNISGLGSSQKYTNCHNEGTISYTATNQDGTNTGLGDLYMGGITVTANAHAVTSYNTGNIVNSGCATNVYMNGLVHKQDRTAQGCYNTGNLTFSGTSTKVVYVGGMAYESDSTIKDCYNTGNINVSATCAGGNAHLYGLVYAATNVIENCYNGEKGSTTKGVLNFTGSAKGTFNSGGITYQTKNNMTNVVNYAPIYYAGNHGGTAYIGGVGRVGIIGGTTWTEVVNYGNITLSGVCGDVNIVGSDGGSDIYLGGLFSTSTATSAKTELASLVRCQNHGDLIFTETLNCSGAIRAAGMIARWEHDNPFYLEDCWNSGDFTFNGNTATRDGGNFKVAGVVGYNSKGALSVKGSIINSGNITINGDCTKPSIINVGGIFGELVKSVALAEGATECLIANTGDVTYNGGDNPKNFYAGGVLADFSGSYVFAEGINLVNIGDVSVAGALGTAEGGESYVGGVVGKVTRPIPSAQSYCTVNATGYKGVGMITGAHNGDKIVVNAGGVGGYIYASIEDQNSGVTTGGLCELTSDNWFKYIYGSELTAAPEGLQFLTEAPVVTLPAELPAATTPEVTE